MYSVSVSVSVVCVCEASEEGKNGVSVKSEGGKVCSGADMYPGPDGPLLRQLE